MYEENISSKEKQKLTFYFKRAKNMIEKYEKIKQHEVVDIMRNFVWFAVMKLPNAESFGLNEAKEKRLSQIIAEISLRET